MEVVEKIYQIMLGTELILYFRSIANNSRTIE